MNSFFNQDQITYDNEKDDVLKFGKNSQLVPRILTHSPRTNSQQQSHDLSYDEKEENLASNRQINILQIVENGIAFSNTNRLEINLSERNIEETISKNAYPSCDSIEQKALKDKQPDSYSKSKFKNDNTYTSLKIDLNMNSQKDKDDIFSKNNSFLQQSEQQSNMNSGSPTNMRQNSNIFTKTPRVRSKEIFFFKAQHVKKFISKLKNKTMSYFLSLISRSVFDLLDDRSSDYNKFVHYRNTKQKIFKVQFLINKMIIILQNRKKRNLSFEKVLQEQFLLSLTHKNTITSQHQYILRNFYFKEHRIHQDVKVQTLIIIKYISKLMLFGILKK